MPFPTKQIDLSEVHWLLDAGESVHQIARTMNVTVSGIEQAARRAGDLHVARICSTAQSLMGEGCAA